MPLWLKNEKKTDGKRDLNLSLSIIFCTFAWKGKLVTDGEQKINLHKCKKSSIFAVENKKCSYGKRN